MVKTLWLLGCCVLASVALAEQRWVDGTPVGLYSAAAESGQVPIYGGCAVLLSEGPSELANCSNNWVTFACYGTSLNSMAQGRGNYDLAQLALVTSRTLRVYVNDLVKINGFCYASAATIRDDIDLP